MNIGSTAITNTLGIAIGSNVKFYDVWFKRGGTDMAPIRVYTTCNSYTPVLIHFLNRWGVWDTHRFDLLSRLMMDVERKGFMRNDYKKNGNAIDYKSSANRYYESKINYGNTANWIYKLTSDSLTDDEYTWLSDLVQSPQMLMEVDGYCYPATIKNTNYEYSKYENNKLRVLELEFEMNQMRNTQLR
jgi:hypothetical protein